LSAALWRNARSRRRTAPCASASARPGGELIGRSRPMEELRAHLAVSGHRRRRCLSRGRAAPARSSRRARSTARARGGRAVHRLNCGRSPPASRERALWVREGAFTGAAGAKPGQFELAHGGTIFLDEIGECSPELQVGCCACSRSGRCSVSADASHTDGFRLVAATNRNLADEIKAGRFARISFYRINVIEVTMPPLRERARTSRCSPPFPRTLRAARGQGARGSFRRRP